jgi:hypothetical protein
MSTKAKRRKPWEKDAEDANTAPASVSTFGETSIGFGAGEQVTTDVAKEAEKQPNH